MANRLEDLAAAAVGAWAIAGRAWMEAVNEVGVGWLDLADVEGGRASFNEETVVIGPQLVPTVLHPGRFVDWGGNELPAEAVEVDPRRIPPGRQTTVRVRVEPPPGTASGTYTGSLRSAPDGPRLVDEIGVYVVGDSVPAG
ncbi:MAG TPA: hypothetical protein VH703_02530 [Solirubrobacterales bacterium]|jgi:hypothetical protein